MMKVIDWESFIIEFFNLKNIDLSDVHCINIVGMVSYLTMKPTREIMMRLILSFLEQHQASLTHFKQMFGWKEVEMEVLLLGGRWSSIFGLIPPKIFTIMLFYGTLLKSCNILYLSFIHNDHLSGLHFLHVYVFIYTRIFLACKKKKHVYMHVNRICMIKQKI